MGSARHAESPHQLLGTSGHGAAGRYRHSRPTAVQWSFPLESYRWQRTAPAGTIGNTASATVDSVFTSSNTVTINVNKTANLSLRKTINGDSSQRETLPAGSTLTYVFTYQNIGSGDATDVVVTDVLDLQLTGTPTLTPPGSWNSSTRAISWDVGRVAENSAPQTLTVSMQIDPTASTLFNNIATVTWNGGTKNSNIATVDLIAEPFFGLTKAVDKANAGPGDELTYTIDLRRTRAARRASTRW